MGYPPKTLVGSDMDEDIPPHIPDIEDYCRTCLTRKVRCTCKPMSDWSEDLIDIFQTQTLMLMMTEMTDRTKPYPLTGVTRTIFGQTRLMTRSGPFHH